MKVSDRQNRRRTDANRMMARKCRSPIWSCSIRPVRKKQEEPVKRQPLRLKAHSPLWEMIPRRTVMTRTEMPGNRPLRMNLRRFLMRKVISFSRIRERVNLRSTLRICPTAGSWNSAGTIRLLWSCQRHPARLVSCFMDSALM